MTHQLPEPGQRIRLVEMLNDPCPIEVGTLGTVRSINEDPFHGRHQINVKWDSGRSLFLIVGEDKFEVVTLHRVVLIEDNAYARYDLLVEAATPDDAAGIAREMVVEGVESSSGQHFRDDALPYVTDVINHEGEECGFSDEHGHDGVVAPDLLKVRNDTLDVVRWIHAFDIDTDHANYTDSGDAWALLNRIRDQLTAHMDANERAAQAARP